MNAPDSHPDGQLREELSAHLTPVRASTDLTAAAIARATDIRRRRRTMTAAAATLATLLVASPFVWWSVRGSEPVRVPATTSTTSEASTPAPTTTSSAPTTTTTSTAPTPTMSAPTATAAPTYDSDRSSLVVAKLSMSGTVGTPAVPYLTDGVPEAGVRILHTDGKQLRLEMPAEALVGPVLHPLAGDGVAASTLMPGEAEWGLDFFDASGRPVRRVEVAGPAVLGANGGRLAYLDDGADPLGGDDVLHLLDASGRELATLPGRWFPRGVIGDIVYANDAGGETAVAWNSRSGTVKELGRGRIVAVHEASASAVFLPGSGVPGAGTECFRLVTLTDVDMTTRWTSCGQRFAPEQFSPSGAYLIGGAELEGGSPDRRRVLRTSDARFVLDLDGAPNQLMLRDTVFTADEDAVVLATTDVKHNLGLVQCTFTGACRPVVKPLPIDTTHPSGMGIEPYHLLHR